MTDLIAARAQMGMSLAFHIIFAAIGIAMPLLMVIAEGLWLKTKDETYLKIAHRWAKVTAIFFAVGAVSGTVLSFELGLLWPGFMRFAGAIIGMPFSLEGFAFFTEAIFLGIYLYGWDKVSPKVHLLSGIIVSISGALSAIFVVIANAWMNTPAGFRMVVGVAVDIDPIKAMFNPNASVQVIHMLCASYVATGFAVAGMHAFEYWRQERKSKLHEKALVVALFLGGLCALIEPLTGDDLARAVAYNQPEKLAALEGQFQSERGAPLRIGGIPDVKKRITPYAIDIPYGLSLLAYHDINAEVKGLNDFPRSTWPPVRRVHICFQIMVLTAGLMAMVAVFTFYLHWRKKLLPLRKEFLWLVIAAAPLGFIAIEAGWFVTEFGRQPWIIYNLVRTADACTPMPYLLYPFIFFTCLYFALGLIVFFLVRKQVQIAEVQATKDLQ